MTNPEKETFSNETMYDTKLLVDESVWPDDRIVQCIFDIEYGRLPNGNAEYDQFGESFLKHLLGCLVAEYVCRHSDTYDIHCRSLEELSTEIRERHAQGVTVS